MERGTSFLKSKIARRFVFLFILCALAPTVILILISYNQVIGQLEEQSYHRLKREVKAYSISMYDRMLRIDNILHQTGRIATPSQQNFDQFHQQFADTYEELFRGIWLYREGSRKRTIYSTSDTDALIDLSLAEYVHNQKPFVITVSRQDKPTGFYFGANIVRDQVPPFTIIAEVNPLYLWGIGPNPLLPPMTELSVFDSSGNNIVASSNGPTGNYQGLVKRQVSEYLQIFEFSLNGKDYHAAISNLFLESHFQDIGWIILLSRARQDVMSAMDHFKQTFPFIILLFLLVITYLSLIFIRKGLDPLERLKEGTQRIAAKDFSTTVQIDSGDEFEELGNSFNSMADKLNSHFHTLTVLNEIDRAILSSLNRSDIVSTTLHKLKNFFQCDISVYMKRSPHSAEQVIVYTMEGRRMTDPVVDLYPISLDELQNIFIDKELVYLEHGRNVPEFLRQRSETDHLNYLCLPLRVNQKIERTLLLGFRENDVLNEDQLSQARKIANQLAIALANSILVDDLAALARGTIEALARTVDAKSRWTSGHSERVAELGVKIARAMHMSQEQIEDINRAGMLHDIGKIGISLRILDKPDKLSENEYCEIKNHPEIGAKILEPVEAYKDTIPIVLQHHEKFDGSGYPKGLKGEEIDIRARILAVADVWDALVSDRPYREGWVHTRAKDFIIEGKNTHFDPNVVDMFLAVAFES